MIELIDRTRRIGNTLGGVVEVVAHHVPPGLGSHVHWDRRLDSRLAAALMGIQAIKGVEVGDGFAVAAALGSEAHDEIERAADGTIRRRSHRAGGTEGGMSTGEVLRVRAAMKPISTVPRALATVDVASGEPQWRSTSAPTSARCPPQAWWPGDGGARVGRGSAGEFGGDSLTETSRNVRAYLERLAGAILAQGR